MTTAGVQSECRRSSFVDSDSRNRVSITGYVPAAARVKSIERLEPEALGESRRRHAAKVRADDAPDVLGPVEQSLERSSARERGDADGPHWPGRADEDREGDAGNSRVALLTINR